MTTSHATFRNDTAMCQQAAPFKKRPRQLPGEVQRALTELLDSLELAQDAGRASWDFAVEMTTLRETGLGNSELRWLVCKTLIDHARETTKVTDDNRTFEKTGILNFTDETCFIITPAGADLARALRQNPTTERIRDVDWSASSRRSDETKPVWDVDRFELRWQGKLVKKYSVPSPNQRTVLAAFEEEGWPCRVDDPLPPHPELDPKRRLHDTIKSLNRHQKHRLINFIGDGTGEGVRWEPV